MRLRSSITTPTRYEDDDVNMPKSRKGTKPTYQSKLQDGIVPFNPNLPPAAFPSLPLSTTTPVLPMDVSSESEPQAAQSGLDPSLTSGAGAGQHDIQQDSPDVVLQQPDKIGSKGPVDPAFVAPVDDALPLTEVLAIHSEKGRDATWDSLPLSLQYHIYSTLSERNSAKSLAKLLGLTDLQSSQIQKAVRHRSLNPASLAEIWHLCAAPIVESSDSSETPSFVDIDLFNKYLDYMVFAGRYEHAYETEVFRAERFLSSRSIPVGVLGVWIPDPSDLDATEFFIHVPGLPRKPGGLAEEATADSGYSSFSEADHLVEGGDGVHNLQSATGSVNKTRRGRKELLRDEWKSSTDGCPNRQPGVRPTLKLHTHSLVENARQPLANVTKPGESLSLPRGNAGRRSSGLRISDHSTASSPQMTPEPGFGQMEHRSAGSMTLRTRSTLKQTTATNKSRDEQPSTLDSPTTSATPASVPRTKPRRLVLKIQDKDGLARVVTKKPVNGVGQRIQKSDAASKRKASQSDIRRHHPAKTQRVSGSGVLQTPLSTGLIRSPSYSPISENEDLEDFQALLKGPGTRRQRVKVKNTMDDDASITLNGPQTPSSSLSLNFQNRLRMINAGFKNITPRSAHESRTAPDPNDPNPRMQHADSPTPLKQVRLNLLKTSKANDDSSTESLLEDGQALHVGITDAAHQTNAWEPGKTLDTEPEPSSSTKSSSSKPPIVKRGPRGPYNKKKK